jgi:succinate-semialdehyde dehydrogenase / glutarate-semialdehyde dehydrogenase
MALHAEQALVDSVPTGLFIAGEWRSGTSGSSFGVDDPATGETLTEVADGGAEDAAAALDAAVEASASWARTPPRERSDVLRRAFDTVRARADDFALLMTLEMGKPLAEAKGEVTYGNEFLRWFSEEAVRVTGRFGPNPEGTGRMIVSRHPVGPCHLITPWNFPLAMATRKVGPALAAGCTAVIKPADLTPLTTLMLTQVLVEAGLPAGVLNVVTTTDAAAVSGTIIADPRLRKLSFTGSTPVGRRLLGQAAEGVLRTSMELGGNAPFVVFADADVDAAVEGAMLAKFRNIGEACTAANRFVVAEQVAEEFTAKVSERVAAMRVGRGTEEGVQIGPLINEKAREKAGTLVGDAVERGAEVVVGGHAVDGPGTFYEPTVVAGVRPGSRLLREEIFGPVLAVATFADEEEGVALANDTEYGLVGYAYTQDLARALRLVDAMETGMVGINTGVVSNAAAPFGGIKQSGLGREGGLEGIGEYLETRYTLVPDPWR